MGISFYAMKWVWVNTYRYIFSGMNIHLPAILGFTRYQGFDPSPNILSPRTAISSFSSYIPMPCFFHPIPWHHLTDVPKPGKQDFRLVIYYHLPRYYMIIICIYIYIYPEDPCMEYLPTLTPKVI